LEENVNLQTARQQRRLITCSLYFHLKLPSTLRWKTCKIAGAEIFAYPSEKTSKRNPLGVDRKETNDCTQGSMLPKDIWNALADKFCSFSLLQLTRTRLWNAIGKEKERNPSPPQIQLLCFGLRRWIVGGTVWNGRRMLASSQSFEAQKSGGMKGRIAH
jgi:hypothetical protein